MTDSVFDFILLGISFVGLGLLTYSKTKINVAFIPIFLFSIITCIVFFAGLLNIMPHIVYVIYFMGIILFLYYLFIIVFKKKFTLYKFVSPSIIFFVITIGILSLLLKGVIFIQYDDFSHWGLIVKEMFRIGGLPDQTTVIQFRNYPPGIAVFIYYIGLLIGPSESHALMAKGYLILSSLTAFFALCSWKRPYQLILALGGTLVIYSIITGHIYHLLVDAILGMVALSIAIISIYYRNNLSKMALVNLPILILLILIKDSGKLLFVFNILLIVIILISYGKSKLVTKDSWKTKLIVLCVMTIVPLLFNFLWHQYTDKAYPSYSYESNKFSLTTDKITDIQKSEEFIEQLGPMVINAATDINSPGFLSMLLNVGLLIIFAILIRINERKIPKLLFNNLIFSCLGYIIYIVSLYAMYLFLMPEKEAVYLASFGRYQGSAVIFCLGLIIASIVYYYPKIKIFNKSTTIKILSTICILIVFIYPFKDVISSNFSRPEISTSVRQEIIEKYEKVEHSSLENPKILYYSPMSKDDKGYRREVVKYQQLSHNYILTKTVNEQKELDEFISNMKESNYLIVLDSDDHISRIIKQYYNGFQGEDVFEIQINEIGEIDLIPL